MNDLSQVFAETWFGELSEQPCTPTESLAMVAGAFVLGALPVLAIVLFALS